MRAVRGDRQRRRRPRAGVRRRALGRARRRPGAQPVHARRCSARTLYQAFRHDQADLRSARHLQPRQDRRRAAAHRATCATAPATTTPKPVTFFDYARARRLRPAPSRCAAASAPAARRSTGTMCPSYMVDARRAHSTRGRANVAAPGDGRAARRGRARRSMASTRRSICASSAGRARASARSASTWRASRASSSPTTGSAMARRSSARALGHVARARRLGQPLRAVSNWIAASALARRLNETTARHRSTAHAAGMVQRRTLAQLGWPRTRGRAAGDSDARALQRHLHRITTSPEIGVAAFEVLERGGPRRDARAASSAADGR